MNNILLRPPKVISRAEWLNARKELLNREKQLTRLRDEIDQERRALPWVRVEKTYTFDGPGGQRTLSDLFDGRSQLIVSHFMLGPGWMEGCVGCSFRSDHVDGALVHLEHHDVSFVTISRAPLAELRTFQRRMDWRFRWYSSYDSEFNYDYHVSFTPEQLAAGKIDYNYGAAEFPCEELSGISIFYKDDAGDVFHTYSTYGRGDEVVDTAYMYLDLTPKGRNETGPRNNLTDWVRHHDRYDAAGVVNADGRFVPGQSAEPVCHCVKE